MNARDRIVAGFGLVMQQAKVAVVSTVSLAKQTDLHRHVVATAAVATAGAVGAYFLWPVAAPAAAMMKAPGAAGFMISRAAFLANTQLYYHLLRTVGAKAAAAAFVL